MELVTLARRHDRTATAIASASSSCRKAGSLAVMRTLDAIRERVGVRYPGEAVATATR
ncbi:hypothetical protein [Streptomyces sp. NPDC001340]